MPKFPQAFIDEVRAVADIVLDLGVGIKDDAPRAVVEKADREPHAERAATRLVDDAAPQPGAQHVQLGLAHRPLEAEQ